MSKGNWMVLTLKNVPLEQIKATNYLECSNVLVKKMCGIATQNALTICGKYQLFTTIVTHLRQITHLYIVLQRAPLHA